LEEQEEAQHKLKVQKEAEEKDRKKKEDEELLKQFEIEKAKKEKKE
jgi:hypothetical protein